MNLDLPASIAPRVLNALKADARTVDLRALASHFYGLAARVLDLFEEEEVVDVLSDVRGFSDISLRRRGRLATRKKRKFWRDGRELSANNRTIWGRIDFQEESRRDCRSCP